MRMWVDKKKVHEDSAEKALSENDYSKALFHTAKAASLGLMIAENCEGEIAESYLEDAEALINYCEKLKKLAEQQDQKPSQEEKIGDL